MNFKETVLEKLEAEDAEWFGQLYQGEFLDDFGDSDVEANKFIHENSTKYQRLYSRNSGDGSVHIVVLKFNFDDETEIIILVEGYYSSWSSGTWDYVYEAEPFTFTETRYRRKEK